MSEFAELTKAVSDFSFEMILKLDEKKNEGFTGWDKLKSCFFFDEIERHITKAKKQGTDEAVDIANLCMFLWLSKKRKKEREKKP